MKQEELQEENTAAEEAKEALCWYIDYMKDPRKYLGRN